MGSFAKDKPALSALDTANSSLWMDTEGPAINTGQVIALNSFGSCCRFSGLLEYSTTARALSRSTATASSLPGTWASNTSTGQWLLLTIRAVSHRWGSNGLSDWLISSTGGPLRERLLW